MSRISQQARGEKQQQATSNEFGPSSAYLESPDPFNKLLLHSPLGQDERPMAAPAYDSMSTILEVDSEESSVDESGRFDARPQTNNSNKPNRKEAATDQEDQQEADDLEEPLGAFQRNAASSTASGRAAGLLGRVSPVGSGRWAGEGAHAFSGTLSALAQKVERLRSLKAEGQNNSNNKHDDIDLDPDTSSHHESSPEESLTRTDSRPSSAAESSGGADNDDLSRGDSSPPGGRVHTGRKPQEVAREERVPSSIRQRDQSQPMAPPQFGSAESLMMIALSPLVSPRAPTPQRRHADADDTRSRVVEVSNKSTETAIDLRLMQQMVSKFFAETRDQATQSIEFDCRDEFETTGADGAAIRSLGRNQLRTTSQNSQRGATAPAATKSIAVGTEKFSRERFSLLPDTKTRATQTAPNLIDSDRGQSETRRFKLAHLDLIRPVAPQQQQQQNPIGFDVQKHQQSGQSPTPTTSIHQDSQQDATLNETIQPESFDSLNTTSSLRSSSPPPAPAQARIQITNNKQQDAKASAPIGSSRQVTINEKATLLGQTDRQSSQKSQARSSSQNNNSKQIAPAEQSKQSQDSLNGTTGSSSTETKYHESSPEKAIRNSTQPQVPSIPSLKTELRLIIEIKSNRERQTTDLNSESLLTSDGKLTKTTDIKTRKQVAMSPGQVLDRLKSIGREQGDNDATQINLSSYQRTKSKSNDNQDAGYRPSASSGNEPIHWQQVSQSSVRNEMETDTRRKVNLSRSSKTSNEPAMDEILVLSSDARIDHFENDKSAISIKSKAAKRTEGPRLSDTKEVTLVQSEAAFDERDPKAPVDGFSWRRKSQQQQPGSSLDLKGPGPPLRFNAHATATPSWRRMDDTAGQTSDPTPSTRGLVPPRIPPKFARRVLPRAAPPPPPPPPRPQVQSNNKTTTFAKTTTLLDAKSPSLAHPPQREQPVSHASATLELEDQREEIHSISRDGKLVYDDRIRERSYESQRSLGSMPSLNTNDNKPGSAQRKPTLVSRVNQSRATNVGVVDRDEEDGHELRLPLRSVSLSPSSPLSPSARPLRSSLSSSTRHRINSQNQHPSSRSSPQLQSSMLAAEQTSQLSSDRETLDSGFAQSAGGSGSHLNRPIRIHHMQYSLSPPPQFRSSSSLVSGADSLPAPKRLPLVANTMNHATTRHQRLASSMDADSHSINFMDDSDQADDEFVRQLGGSQPILYTSHKPQYSSSRQIQSTHSEAKQTTSTRGKSSISWILVYNGTQFHRINDMITFTKLPFRTYRFKKPRS